MIANTDDRLRLIVERIERLREERKGISDDIREVFSEAKSAGYHAAVIRQIIKDRATDEQQRREMEALVATYRAALGME